MTRPLRGPPSEAAACKGQWQQWDLARTPLPRPTWLVAFLDWPKTDEAPRTPAGAGLRRPREAITRNLKLMSNRGWGGSKTAPPDHTFPSVVV